MAATPLWDMLDNWNTTCRWVDLTHELSPETPHWVGFEAMNITQTLDLDSSIFSTHTYTTVGQYGTHVDVGAHMLKGGRTLERMGIEEMVLPLCVVDMTTACTANPDYVVTRDDLVQWENTHGRIPDRAFVAFRSDWCKRGADGMDNLDADGNRHFPGWRLDALQFLVEERNVAGIGHETSDTEAPATSGATSYEVERYILAQDRFQIELLTNLEQCPVVGAIIFCTFPKLKGGTGFPARCFALCPK